MQRGNYGPFRSYAGHTAPCRDCGKPGYWYPQDTSRTDQKGIYLCDECAAAIRAAQTPGALNLYHVPERAELILARRKAEQADKGNPKP